MIGQTELYEQYHGRILSYMRARLGAVPQAEDLCSEVFVKVCESIGSFDEDKSSLSTWIYTIARNTLTDYYRTRRVWEEIPETMEDGNSVEDDLCNAESLELLANALEALDERGRDIIIGRYYKGMSLRELSERMDISYAYIKTLHNKALASMKKFLENSSHFPLRFV